MYIPNEKTILQNYESAKELFAAYGVDTEQALSLIHI